MSIALSLFDRHSKCYTCYFGFPSLWICLLVCNLSLADFKKPEIFPTEVYCICGTSPITFQGPSPRHETARVKSLDAWRATKDPHGRRPAMGFCPRQCGVLRRRPRSGPPSGAAGPRRAGQRPGWPCSSLHSSDIREGVPTYSVHVTDLSFPKKYLIARQSSLISSSSCSCCSEEFGSPKLAPGPVSLNVLRTNTTESDRRDFLFTPQCQVVFNSK